jgi:hypothetical protein
MALSAGLTRGKLPMRSSTRAEVGSFALMNDKSCCICELREKSRAKLFFALFYRLHRKKTSTSSVHDVSADASKFFNLKLSIFLASHFAAKKEKKT